MTPERLAEIKARHTAATVGPYGHGSKPNCLCPDETVDWVGVILADDEQGVWVDDASPIAYLVDPDNAEFLAHSWQDVSDLVAALEATQAELARLRTTGCYPLPQPGGGSVAADKSNPVTVSADSLYLLARVADNLLAVSTAGYLGDEQQKIEDALDEARAALGCPRTEPRLPLPCYAAPPAEPAITRNAATTLMTKEAL